MTLLLFKYTNVAHDGNVVQMASGDEVAQRGACGRAGRGAVNRSESLRVGPETGEWPRTFQALAIRCLCD